MYNGAAVFSGRRFSRALGGSPRGGANDQGHFAASRRRGAAARLTKEEAQLAENVTVLAFFAMIAAVVALGSPWWVTRPELNPSAAHALAPDACRFQLHIGLWHYCSEMTGEQCATTVHARVVFFSIDEQGRLHSEGVRACREEERGRRAAAFCTPHVPRRLRRPINLT